MLLDCKGGNYMVDKEDNMEACILERERCKKLKLCNKIAMQYFKKRGGKSLDIMRHPKIS